MLDQCYRWKHYQAVQINRLLDRTGSLYQPESFDHLIRDGEHLQNYRNYLKINPEKAELSGNEYILYLPDLT